MSRQRSIAYGRVSTPGQARSGLGLEAQTARCRAYAEAMGYLPVTTYQDTGVSGAVAPDQRPALSQALSDLAEGRADVLIAASLSRLGRRTRDILDLADRADTEGWALVVLDLQVDTSSPSGRLVLTVLAAVAQLERAQTIERTTAALAAARARGQRLGAPASARTRAAGLRVEQLRAERPRPRKWREIVDVLTEEGYQTPKGGPWHITGAQRALRTLTLDRDAAARTAAALTGES